MSKVSTSVSSFEGFVFISRTRQADHPIPLRNRTNALCCLSGRSVAPRITVLVRDLSELRVHVCRLGMVVGDGLIAMCTETVLVERIDLYGVSDRVRCAQICTVRTRTRRCPLAGQRTWFEFSCSGREDSIVVFSELCPPWRWQCLCCCACSHWNSQSRGPLRLNAPVHDAKASPPVMMAIFVSPLEILRAASSNSLPIWLPPCSLSNRRVGLIASLFATRLGRSGYGHVQLLITSKLSTSDCSLDAASSESPVSLMAS